jgi:DNA-binding FadR family transcriptional regulator
VTAPVYLGNDPQRHGVNLAASVAAAIERHIVERGWPVGEVIGSEAELLARYGVSRPVLRQAAHILESHQVARMRRGPGGGLVVVAPDWTSVATGMSLYLEHQRVDPARVGEARESIELTCVELAAARIDEPGIARLRELVATEASRVAEHGLTALLEVHEAIGALSGNPVLEVFVRTLMTLSHQQYVDLGPGGGEEAPDLPETMRDHQLVVEAIVAGDAALARHRMLRHLHATSYEPATNATATNEPKKTGAGNR